MGNIMELDNVHRLFYWQASEFWVVFDIACCLSFSVLMTGVDENKIRLETGLENRGIFDSVMKR